MVLSRLSCWPDFRLPDSWSLGHGLGGLLPSRGGTEAVRQQTAALDAWKVLLRR